MKRQIFAGSLFTMLMSLKSSAQNFITNRNQKGGFPMVPTAQSTSIFVDAGNDWLVQKEALLLIKMTMMRGNGING